MKFLQPFLSSAHPSRAIAGLHPSFMANPKQTLRVYTPHMDARKVVCPRMQMLPLPFGCASYKNYIRFVRHIVWGHSILHSKRKAYPVQSIS